MRRAVVMVGVAVAGLPVAAWLFACDTGGSVAQPLAPVGPQNPADGGTGDATLPDAAGDTGGVPVDAGCQQIPIPDGAVVTVTGTVVAVLDGSTSPIGDAMVAAEYGGLYAAWCDLSHASPYYVFGAVTDSQGKFTMTAKDGILGFHSFATGYLYTRSRLDTTDGGSTATMLSMEAISAVQKKPIVTSAAFDKTTVAPGGSLTFSAQVKAGAAGDPLSDEILLVEPSRFWSSELDPPSVGLKDNFPDGLWQKTFPAPSVPGTYTYYFSATASLCETSDVQTFTITVQ